MRHLGKQISLAPYQLRPRGVIFLQLQVSCHVGSPEQGVDVHCMVQRRIRLEGKVGGDTEAHLVRDLATEVNGRALQGREQRLNVGAAKAGDEGGGVAEVGADADLGDSDAGVREVGVAELPTQEHPGQHVADFLPHAELALRGGLGRRGLRRPRLLRINLARGRRLDLGLS